MSVASEITRIQNAKASLKTSINAKTDAQHQINNETIDDYADFVDSIQTGGGGSSNNVYVDMRLTGTYAYATGITSMITSIDLLDTSLMFSLRNFLANSKIVTLPLLDTSNATTMREMLKECPNLENVPVLNTSKVTTMQSMFSGSKKLTDTSLDNILKMCIGTTSAYTRTKSLAELGFISSNYPASRIQALPSYQDFLDAGWTIGY